MGVAVANKPKKNSGPKPEESPPGSEEQAAEKKTAMVRLRPSFHKKLARVAKDAGQDIGVFIEDRLSNLVDREYRRSVLEEARKLQEGEG